MKYALVENTIPDISDSYIRDYLISIGIEDYQSFLYEPPKYDEISPLYLDNMEKAISIFYKHITKENPRIFLVVDSDADGYTSSAIFYQLAKEINPNCEIIYYMHEGKEHGIVLDSIPEGIDLIAILDAGSNQKTELEVITQTTDVIILDHHEIEEHCFFEHEKLALVNNQSSSNFSNKSLCGAGVTFKFAQQFSAQYPQFHIDSDKWYDLAALGIISDMMVITTLDNHYIINKGLNNIKSPMLKALLKQQSYSISSETNPGPIDIAFYITPLINGVIRMDNKTLKENLFLGFACPNQTELYNHEFRGVVNCESFYEKTARESYNIKNRQNNILEDVMESISYKIEKEGKDNDKIIIYKTSLNNPNEIQKTLTGLLAMKISQKYCKPALVLRPIKENNIQYYRGSGRGKLATGFTSFKDYLNNSGLVEFAQGHAMAFGCSIEEDKIDELILLANEELKDIDFGENITEVNYIFKSNQLNPQMLYEFARYFTLYGNGIPQPNFAFELTLSKDDFKIMGKKNDTISFSLCGIKFIKFLSKDLAEEVSNLSTGFYKVNVIGRPSLNEFRGNFSTQIKIDEIEIKPTTISDFI